MMNGWMKTTMQATSAVRALPATGVRMLDNALTIVDKIRTLESRRLAVFWASPVGRRRLLLRAHGDASAGLVAVVQREVAASVR